MNTQSVSVLGMTCGHCKAAIEEAVLAVDGVASATVDLEANSLNVTGGELSEIFAAIVEAGYEAK